LTLDRYPFNCKAPRPKKWKVQKKCQKKLVDNGKRIEAFFSKGKKKGRAVFSFFQKHLQLTLNKKKFFLFPKPLPTSIESPEFE